MSDPNGLPPQTPPPGYPEGFQATPVPEAMQPPAPMPQSQPFVNPSQAPAPQQYPGHQNPAQPYTPQNYPAQPYPPQQYIQSAPVPQYQPADPSAMHPQAGYPGHPGYPPAPLPASTPHKKIRMGLIISILVTVTALVVGAIFAIPYLTAGNPALSDNEIIPSDAWANGVEVAWELKGNIHVLKNDRIIATEIAEYPDMLVGYDISGSGEPQLLWTTDIDGKRAEWVRERGNLVYVVLVDPQTVEKRLTSFDLQTGEEKDVPFGDPKRGHRLSIGIQEDVYVRCDHEVEHLYSSDSSEITLSKTVGWSLPMDVQKLKDASCAAYDYNSNQEIWSIEEGEFPNVPGSYFFDEKTGKITPLEELEKDLPRDDPYVQFLTASDHGLYFRQLDQTPYTVTVWDETGAYLGTITLDKDLARENHRVFFHELWRSDAATVKSLLNGDPINLRERYQGKNIVKNDSFISPSGTTHELPLSNRNVSRFATSPNGSVIFVYRDGIEWVGLDTEEQGLLPEKYLPSDASFLSLHRPDLMISKNYEKKRVVALRPKE